MPDLTARLGPLTLRNPLLLASGIWGESADSLVGAWAAGAGGVITKSIGAGPRPGYPNPTVEPLDGGGMLNAMGLPNPGVAEYPAEVRRAVAAGATVVGSIFGGSPEEFAALAGPMADAGVVALELNLSCPHAEGYGTEIGSDPGTVEAVVRAVAGAVRVPVIAKLTPNAADLASLARAAERGGARAVSAINTVRALAIDAELGRPVLAHGLGGLSGPPIKPVGLAAVWQISRSVSVPVIGVGGIRTATDVVEYLLAGAGAVEIGTAVALDGIGTFGRIARNLAAWMERHGVGRLEDLVGRAHGSGRGGGEGVAGRQAISPAP
ncbi:MAG: dihydroorotate dehydrogenase [Thermoplasmata archaeon]